jgi:hypothetical protein
LALWGRTAADLLFAGRFGHGQARALDWDCLRRFARTGGDKPTGLPRIHEISIDIPVLLFTAGLALFTSLLIGAIPIAGFAGARAASPADFMKGGRDGARARAAPRARPW